MRFGAAVVGVILLLGGAFYFFATARGNAAGSMDRSRFDQPAPAPTEDRAADEYDRTLVRALLDAKNLTEDQSNSLLQAAGRRYMRRKLAYASAIQAVAAGKAAAGTLDPLRREMEAARKLCDVAESLGRRHQESIMMAQENWELERRLAYMPSTVVGLVERFDGAAAFSEADLGVMERAFQEHFGKPLPVSARGDGPVHRAMGFDHRGRFDLAVSPSQPEGVWARRYLTEKHVTFFAFRSAVPGKATGAHIHVGPASTHRAPTTSP
jgi:hypothetical protein